MASDTAKIGLGAASGAGITALFTALPIGKILTGSTSTSFSPAYPLFIFAVVAVVAILGIVLTTQLTRAQQIFAIVGVAMFAVVALTGATVIYRDAFDQPTITVASDFEPPVAEFRDPDTVKPIKLQLYYSIPDPRIPRPKLVPFSNGALTVRSGQMLQIRLVGFEDLTGKYHGYYDQLGTLQSYMASVCSRQRADPVCFAWTDLRGGVR